MSVRKDPRSPYWQYDFQRHKQRFHGSTLCTTRRDAERYEAELKRKIALGDQTKDPITLDQACELYWSDKGQHEANAGTTEYQLANLCTIIGKDRMLSSLRQKDLREFVAKRRGQGVSNASVNREWELARRVWAYALKGGYDVPIPGTEHSISWKDLRLEERKRTRELSQAEQRALFKALPADLARVVEFALLSGQRKSAIIGLRRDHVDLDGMRARVHTKGDRWHSFPLSPRMAKIIREAPEVEGCPFVFTYECERPSPPRKDRKRRYRGQRYPFSPEGWSRKWYKALKDAKIADFRFHDLRHTSASRVVRASGNLKSATALLGHTDISTTSRYAHVLEADLREALFAAESQNSHGMDLPEVDENATES